MANFFINLINFIIEGCGSILSFLLSLLPPSPFQLIDSSGVQQYLPWLNWLFPISQMISILEAWVSSILLYYVVQVALRWIKAIE